MNTTIHDAHESTRSRILGSLIGLSVGDALGATLEFAFDGATPEPRVETALGMPGGGCHGVAPGQVTDDTELALALASALADRDPADGFPASAAVDAYRAWFASDPFDVGITCSSAFCPRHGLPSATSQSNGSLMRIAPLAAWAASRDDADIARLAIADASITHDSRIVHLSTAAYAVTVAALVRGERPREAIEKAEAWLELEAAEDPAARTVLAWAARSPVDGEFTDAVGERQGWAKHAFRLAFYHLRNGSAFEDAMAHVLGVGGDTDTNAAIVGAAMGARDGFEKIPPEWFRAVLHADAGRGRPRPTAYHPREFFAFVDGLGV